MLVHTRRKHLVLPVRRPQRLLRHRRLPGALPRSSRGARSLRNAVALWTRRFGNHRHGRFPAVIIDQYRGSPFPRSVLSMRLWRDGAVLFFTAGTGAGWGALWAMTRECSRTRWGAAQARGQIAVPLTTYNWYNRALTILTGQIRARFIEEYENHSGSSKGIRRFLSDPTATFAVPLAQGGTPGYEPRRLWKYPLKTAVLTHLQAQRLALMEAVSLIESRLEVQSNPDSTAPDLDAAVADIEELFGCVTDFLADSQH